MYDMDPMTRHFLLFLLCLTTIPCGSVFISMAQNGSPAIEIPVAESEIQGMASCGQAEAERTSVIRYSIRSEITGNSASLVAVSPDPVLFPESGDSKKSPFQAVLYSLLLPGMGELYAGRFDRGLYPLVLEGILWTGFAGFNLYGGWIKEDARTFAQLHASLHGESFDDQFYVNIGNYNSLDQYNSIKLIERDLSALYANETQSRFYWNWDSDESRLSYKELRIHSDQMYNAGKFVVVGLIANRIWSAIQSALLVKKHNAALVQGFPSLRTELLSVLKPGDGIRVTLLQPF